MPPLPAKVGFAFAQKCFYCFQSNRLLIRKKDFKILRQKNRAATQKLAIFREIHKKSSDFSQEKTKKELTQHLE